MKKPKINLPINSYARDIDGNIIINMTVSDDSDFLSPYSAQNTPIISQDVSDFLENSVQAIPIKENFSLKIHSNCIDDDEKKLYSQGIKQYYADRTLHAKRELMRNIIIAIILGVMGLITLGLAHLVDFAFNSVIWSEAVDIAAWVFLWECVDILAFKIRSLRISVRRCSAFCAMNIEFLPIEKD